MRCEGCPVTCTSFEPNDFNADCEIWSDPEPFYVGAQQKIWGKEQLRKFYERLEKHQKLMTQGTI